jgi:hypothetical protein
MCRSIKQLRRPEGPPTDEELRAAALQFVRKVSGYRAPSRANQQAFDEAVEAVTASTRVLLERLNYNRPLTHNPLTGAGEHEGAHSVSS